ncbi:hypothetical protein C8A05DRAFT_34177 [Staphylotrichum tortipilum]|uniref:C2H2-type domain-containing protein n=1 Tax=Staphylotrichum tortipilum TaxID=2831512 RepID=A0AAN6MKW0_9PEZI|nr:hypothetical protein C8A05DRAFT_34177 [Staphylotrichum longicolle]
MYELSATAHDAGPLHSAPGIGSAAGAETNRPPADAQERANATTKTTERRTSAAVPQPDRGYADATTVTTGTIAANVAGTNTSASNAASTRDARPRPVFKMRRTGHSGMFPWPFSSRNPVPAQKQPSPVESDGSGSGSGSGGGGGNAAGLGPSSALKRTFATFSTPDEGAGTVDGAHAGPRDKHPPIPDRPTPIPLISIPSSPASQDEAMAMESPSAENAALRADTATGASTPVQMLKRWPARADVPPDVQQLFNLAPDNGPYKSWTDEQGTVYQTAGALLPAGYRKTDDPYYPWLCPVRSCRKMLPSFSGLGKHFCNSHRATQLNDNMDGTLTDLGPYSDPTHGNGRSSGGFARPCLVISQKPMTLDESPMAEPSLHRKAPGGTHPTVPKRGGPRRRSTAASAAPEADDDSDSAFEETQSLQAATAGDPSRVFDMANPDRPYNQWPGPSGQLITTYGALLPDGYEQDTTLPDRPWICPLRLCRRLYGTMLALGNHFHLKHRGCRLNDNLDGTLSFFSTDSTLKRPVIASRMPMDSEEIVEPTRPVHPFPNSKHVNWVRAITSDQSATLPSRTETPIETSRALSPDPKPVDDEPEAPVHEPADAGIGGTITETASGRPYEEWWDDLGGLSHMAGALIPDGYQNDDTYPSRPWICPIRSCRTEFWRELSAHIDGPISTPDIPELRLLLALPKARRVVPDRPLPASLTTKQIAGLLIQAIGEEVRGGGCTGCRRNQGPFSGCVRLTIAVANDVVGLLRTTRRACGNCFLRKEHGTCSIKANVDVYSRAVHASLSREAYRARSIVIDGDSDARMDDAALAAPLNLFGRRRSARISLAQTEQNGDGDDAEGEESDEAPLRENRAVTLRVPQQQQQQQQQQQAVRRQVAAPVLPTRTPPSESDLRMEEWEMEGGRLVVGGEALAFSNPHHTTQTPITLSPFLSFHTIPLPSGQSHTFLSELSKTRVCTVATAAGRLHVTVRPVNKVKGTQEENFVVGVQGVFKLLPGRECTVVNRGYVDVVVQVVSAGVQ